MTYYIINENKEVIGKSTNYGAAMELAEALDPNGNTYLVSALTIEGLKREIEEL
jgi:hypothetical protein